MADAAYEVVRIGPDDWATFRDVRLAALIDAPSAFGSTYAREAAFEEATWRERAGGLTWLALADGRPLGTVSLYAAPELPEGSVMLVGMWVAGEYRGSGVADALVAAALDGAARQGFAEVVLYVEGGNERAAAFYTRTGFGPADLPPWTTAHGACEQAMCRSVK